MSNSTSFLLRDILVRRSEIVPIDPSDAPFAFYATELSQYFQVAIVTVLVYESAITMDKEVKFFWKIPRAAVDYVYFLNRYVGIFGSVAFLYWNKFTSSPVSCEFAEWTQNIANWVTLTAVDYILMIRVLALYSQDKRLSICLGLLFVVVSSFKLAMVIYLDTLNGVIVGELAEDLTFCGKSNSPSWQLGTVDWLVPMVYGAILMVLAVYKAAGYWRASAGFKSFALVKILIRDQVVYFMFVIMCCMFAILGFRLIFSNGLLANVLNLLGNPALLTILGSRMLCNLKEAGERGLNEGTNIRAPSRTVTGIEFAEPANRQMESGGFVESTAGTAEP